MAVDINQIKIESRSLTTEEVERMNYGFDQLYIEDGIAQESIERLSFVALQENEFIAAASGSANKNGNDYSGWFFLSDLYVEKEYRSMGLGAKILKTLEEQLISIGIKYVWLWTSGPKSLKFYRREGYYIFTEMESWYSDGSSRVGLRKELTSK